jgi:hypothetical protein
MDLASVFERIKSSSGDPKEACRLARSMGSDTPSIIRALRTVFTLSLSEAKEILVSVDSDAEDLKEYQARLLPALKTVVEDESDGIS